MKKKQSKIDPLCAAVKRIREAYGDSQERFGRRIGIATMTISRFERGTQIPRDPGILMKLMGAASKKNMEGELRELGNAYQEITLAREIEHQHQRFSPGANYVEFAMSPAHWRYLAALRISMQYSPESLHAVETALAWALKLVDAALLEVEPQNVDYRLLDMRVTQLADQQELVKLQEKSKDQ